MPNTRLTFTAFAMFVWFCVQVAPVQAQSQTDRCAPRADIVAKLNDRFGETRQSFGIVQHNKIVEIFASMNSGSWSILFTDANGYSCLIAAGTQYHLFANRPNTRAIET